MKTEVRAAEPRGNTREFFRVGDLIVDTGRARVTRNEVEVPLPKLSFDLLLALLRAAPNLVSADELMTQVWPGLVVNFETISQRVKLLRDALGDDPKHPSYIAAVRGRGYRIIADVSSLDAPVARVPAQPVAGTRRAPARPLWFAAALCLLLASAVLVALLWRQPSKESGERVAVTAIPMRSVAVLPFENVSTDPHGAVLTLGMSESVIHQLATHPQLMVIARTSSFAVAGRNLDAREIGRMLNARYLLEGSVQSGHGRLRVIAQLIDSTSGVRVWSMRFDRTPQDLFAVQDEIARSVAQALEASVTVSAVDKSEHPETKSLGAWIAYQQGRSLAATRKQPDLEQAKVRLAEAIRYDPQFASAYVALAETRLLLTLFSTSDSWLSARPRFASEQDRKEVEELLARAIAINPQDGRAYLVRAWTQDDQDLAERDYRRGLQLNPNDSTGHERFAKLLYFFHGPNNEFFDPQKREEAFEMVERARQLDPLTPNAHITKALMTLYGRYDVEQANALLLQALATEPNYYPALMRLAEIRWCCQGETAEAVRFGEQALSLAPQAAWPRHFLTYMYLEIGDQTAAQRVAAEGTTSDAVLQMIIHFSRREWQAAGELAYGELQTVLGVDMAIIYLSVLQHARATGELARARRVLQEWSEVTWDARGEPQFDATHFAFGAHMALAQVLRMMGDEARAKHLLERVLKALDHQKTTFRQDAKFQGIDRPKALALLGRQAEALEGLRTAYAAKSIRHQWYVMDEEPAFAGLHDDADYQLLLQEMAVHRAAQRRKLEAMRAEGLVPRRGESTSAIGKSQ